MHLTPEIVRALLDAVPTTKQEHCTTAARIPSIDGSYLVEVLGYIMLQKVVPGQYRVVINNGLARFYKPKGNKLVVAHHEGSVRGANGRDGDLNGINYLGVANQETQRALDACRPELAPGEGYDLAITFGMEKYTDYTAQVRVTAVDHQTKEYTLETIHTCQTERRPYPSRQSFAQVHKQLREDLRLTLVRDHYQEKLDAQHFGQDGTHEHEPVALDHPPLGF